MDAHKNETTKALILEYAQCDHIMLCDIIGCILEKNPSLTDREIKAETLAIIHEMLVENLVVAGDVRGVGHYLQHDRWTGTTEQVINRISHEWNALARRPSLGDVCWFTITHQGEAYLDHHHV